MSTEDRKDAATEAAQKIYDEIWAALNDPEGGLPSFGWVELIAKAIKEEATNFSDRKKLEALLQAAVCPECDGSGATVQEREYTVPRCCGRALPNGDCCGTPEPDVAIESVIEPCQWHSERAAILGESKP